MKTIIFLSFLICLLGLACQIDAGKSEKTPICPPPQQATEDKCAVMIVLYRPECRTDDHCSIISSDRKCCPNDCGQLICQSRYFDYI